jgi:chaperonin cofactor prefoldin
MSTKKALIISCNYINTPNQLQGCINDGIQWHGLLQDAYGFDENDILFLRDDKLNFRPTKQRILTELTNLINYNPTYLCIIYSGHGTSFNDINKDEKDGMDECIVPSDYQTSGIILDDDLNKILSASKSSGIAIFDCCRSGTVLDLENEGIINTNKPDTLVINTQNKIICLSGCKDDQTAAEVYNLMNMVPQGALTITLINALRKLKYYPKMSELLNYIKNDLNFGGLTQQPVLTSTYPVYNDTLFPLIPMFINSNLSGLTTQNNDLKTQISTLTTQNNDLKTQVTTLTNQTNNLKTQITTFTTQINDLNGQISTLTSQNNDLKMQISTLTSQNIGSKNRIAILTNTISNLNGQIALFKRK